MAWPRSLLLLVALLPACSGGSDGTTTADASASTSATDVASTGSDTSDATGSSGQPTTTTNATDDTVLDECNGRPGGGWNSCQDNSSNCGFVDNGGQGTLTCLTPQSGNFSVCGIRDCVDDCDCWAPPKTGAAPAVCTPIFGDGGKACVLYCVNGQKCPDGMECASGTCYWPDV